ncbi:MAG: hypothetical protein OXU45_02655 [Candidatus Melainabacteria bacterium]|nr:hypothetical protein [Candidatus Melainabacteria bacterium]
MGKPRLIYSLMISLGIALWVEARVFTDSYAINDDVRNQIYWMAKFVDPGFFANDYIASYFNQSSMVSPMLASLYKFWSFFADPKILTQYLPFVIILATTYFLYKACEIHAGPNYAFWISLVFNLYIWTMKYTAGGLPRAFFYLLFFLFFWMLAKRAWGWLVFCFVLQALIYPTASFLSLVTLLIESFRSKLSPKIFAGATAISAVILCTRYLYFKVPSFGPLTTLEQAKAMPEFYIDGRAAVFITPYSFTQTGFDWSLINDMLIKFWDQAYIFLVVLAALVISFVAYKKLAANSSPLVNMPAYLYSSSFASIGLFILAYLTLFYLYLPHRYIAYTLPLVPVYIVGALLFKLEQDSSRRPWLVWLVVILLSFGISKLWREDLIHVSKPQRKLFTYLASTPKEAMIAAPMDLASNIVAFAYRSVIANSETNIPFHQAYYQEITKRVQDLEQLFKTEDLNYIQDFVQEYNIDYLVIDTKDSEFNELSPLRSLPAVYSNHRYQVIDTQTWSPQND